MSRYHTVVRDGHATVVVGPAIENVSSCVVGDANERIICCRLLIVSYDNEFTVKWRRWFRWNKRS